MMKQTVRRLAGSAVVVLAAFAPAVLSGCSGSQGAATEGGVPKEAAPQLRQVIPGGQQTGPTTTTAPGGMGRPMMQPGPGGMAPGGTTMPTAGGVPPGPPGY